jgi:antitoxin MazE
MRRQVQRWGNSLAVRIPASVAEDCALVEGSPVEVRVEDGRILLVPEPRARRKYTLGELVSRISRRNRQPSVASGRRVGREAW